MAACGGLQHIFEKPLPESPKLLESLSLSPWKQIKTVDSSSSCRDFFGKLHFEEHHHHDVESSSLFSSSSPSPSPLSPDYSLYPTTPVPSYSFFEDVLHPEADYHKDDNQNQSKNERGRNPATTTTRSSSSYCPIKQYSHSDSFSSMNSESLSMCTEGLGFESTDDVEDMISNEPSFDFYNHHRNNEEKAQPQTQGFSRNVQSAENSCNKESKRATNNKWPFPPPISCIGRTGKPWVSFKSFREDGRFILQEIRIPTQEFLHACREDGRLRLQLIHSDDEILEEEEETGSESGSESDSETESESESEPEPETGSEGEESEEGKTEEKTEEKHDDDIQEMKEENEENKETDGTEI